MRFLQIAQALEQGELWLRVNQQTAHHNLVATKSMATKRGLEIKRLLKDRQHAEEHIKRGRRNFHAG